MLDEAERRVRPNVMRGFHKYRLRYRYQILCVGADRRVRPRVSKIHALAPESLMHACAVDASRACRGRRMKREILMANWFGWAFRYRSPAKWVDHPRWQV